MNDLLATVLAHPLARAVGAALLHSLWQITLIGALLAVALRMSRQCSAQWRYALSTAALLSAVAATAATGVLYVASGAVSPVAGMVYAGVGPPHIAGSFTPPLPVALAGFQAWLSVAWAVMAGLLLSRLGLEFLAVRRLVRVDVKPAPFPLVDSARVLAVRLEISRVVRVLESGVARVPMVIGWLRPVVLLPTAMITGLAHGQLEMLLAHELAHVRRYDFFVNALQRVIEALLFYHPVLRWISRQISLERENCCDDMAVQVCSDRIGYARALAAAAEFRLQATPVFALGVISMAMPMKARIVRLLPHSDRKHPRHPVGKLLALFAVLMVIVMANVDQAPIRHGGSVAGRLLQLPPAMPAGGMTYSGDDRAVRSDAMPPVDDLNQRDGRMQSATRTVPSATAGKVSRVVDPSLQRQRKVERQVAINLDALALRAGGNFAPSQSSSKRVGEPPATRAKPLLERSVDPTSTQAPLASSKSVEAIAQTHAARVFHAPPPVYPSIARRRLIEGEVVVEFQVKQSGRVANIRLLGSPQLYLARAVEKALSQWRFDPAVRDGQAVPSTQRREFSFHLDLAGLEGFKPPATTGTHIH